MKRLLFLSRKRENFADDIIDKMFVANYKAYLRGKRVAGPLRRLFGYYEHGCYLDFAYALPRIGRDFSKFFEYHYGIATQNCDKADSFFVGLKHYNVAEADILYNKGFDKTDLLMLADLVDDEKIATALRTCDRFERGFWALDTLRDDHG